MPNTWDLIVQDTDIIGLWTLQFLHDDIGTERDVISSTECTRPLNSIRSKWLIRGGREQSKRRHDREDSHIMTEREM